MYFFYLSSFGSESGNMVHPFYTSDNDFFFLKKHICRSPDIGLKSNFSNTVLTQCSQICSENSTVKKTALGVFFFCKHYLSKKKRTPPHFNIASFPRIKSILKFDKMRKFLLRGAVRRSLEMRVSIF